MRIIITVQLSSEDLMNSPVSKCSRRTLEQVNCFLFFVSSSLKKNRMLFDRMLLNHVIKKALCV